MKKKNFLLSVIAILTLLSACRGRGITTETANITPLAASDRSSAEVTQTNVIKTPTDTLLVETLSPTPNIENDRPAPPTEAPPPTKTSSSIMTSTPRTTLYPPNSLTASPSPDQTHSSTATSGPSPTASRTTNPTRTPTGTLPTPTPSITPSGTLRTPTPTRTVRETQLASSTPTLALTLTFEPGLSFTIEFISHYSCQGIDFLNFRVRNRGSLPLEYAKVMIFDLSRPYQLSDSFTNWPFQTLPDGCDNDLGLIPPGESAYMPVPINESPIPPYPGEHEGTFTFCSENYYKFEQGQCLVEQLTFTIPGG